MLDELRERISQIVATNEFCVLGACGWNGGPWALPTPYRSRGLEVECLLPAWAEIISHLDEDPEVLLVVHPAQAEAFQWLQIRGRAVLLEAPDWTGWPLPLKAQKQAQTRCAVLHITPQRIDLIDERRGWGFRETLDY